jgi:hypothetical protein
MDPGRPGIGEEAGLSHRVIAVHRLLVEVTLVQADALAATQIDRRVQVHPWIIAPGPIALPPEH